MNTGEWIKVLGIPNDAIVDRNFPKKILYQNAELSSSEKELIKDGVKRLRWLASIKENNTNVPKYEDEKVRYEEIQYFFLEVSSQDMASKISKFLFNSVPYPQVLIISFEEKYHFQMALTKKNLSDTNSLILENVYVSQWKTMDSMAIREELSPYHYSNQKMTNLKEYYESLLVILLSDTVSISGKNRLGSSKEVIQFFDEFQELDEEIQKLMKLVKLEKQLNKRIELQLKLTQLKNQQKKLLSEYRGD
ncbi:DUF4391 domain-containing protein [Carnobacterium mobile]|uniref:DUF4391 domain-containing protein n=1 Tax=Carnobacterium mobile TaxID=2750 RepID=UPI0005566F1C|nr:DUF4391 domain-containing protein [Carnobacterium mobile]